MLRPENYEVLTFDCYGTLIDWEQGILAALAPVLSAHGLLLANSEVLRLYAEAEAAAEEGRYVKYRTVLRRVVQQLGHRLGFTPSEAQLGCLARSLGTWPPFLDTVAALHSLKRRFRLAIISNVDRDLFVRSARLLQTEFDWIITAEQARSYKPSPNNFRLAIETIGIPSDKVLHVAQSIRHDIVPAKALGLSTVWVNPGKGLGRKTTASGADPSAASSADLEVPDLKTLASLMTSGEHGG